MAAIAEDPDAGTPYYGGIARLWDLSDGRLRREWKFDHRATFVAFSADGRRMAVTTWNPEASIGMLGKHGGQPDDTVRVFDVDTGQSLAELRGHEAKIVAFAFAPDKRSLVTASQDMSFRFWDPDTGKQTRQLAITGHTGKGNHVRIAATAFAPDLKWAVTSGEQDDQLIVWDLSSGDVRRTIRVEGDLGSRVAISPDGRRFSAVASYRRVTDARDYRIRLWDMASGRELLSLATEGKRVASLAFAPDGRSLATGMADTTAIVWDLGRAIPREEQGKMP